MIRDVNQTRRHDLLDMARAAVEADPAHRPRRLGFQFTAAPEGFMAGPLPAGKRKRVAWGDTLAERIHARSRQYPAPGGTFAGPSIGCDLHAIQRDRSGRGPETISQGTGSSIVP